ncbi:Dabb family protein [Amycolatopsis jiangsuensis]|uniref:Stress-response A/B barrel domain-containing protein n=1 Tax=Amycolatopsis jiangsuensis TaxID=1181879 RepID=A0A840J0S0_9PSEU|nr:Dabb family protein [Amycolatopsis jiangsuensis]MBB4686784.1 hypothetical protein [Amycolatopsis jiangsuensis]
MIYHCNRMKLKQGLPPEQIATALEHLKEQGRIPAVQSFVVGPEHGSEFDWGAIFVLADLDAYWEYLTHPAHKRSERAGVPLLEKFECYDVSDDPDPGLEARIAELQKRNYEADPELVTLMAGLASHTGSSAVTHAA